MEYRYLGKSDLRVSAVGFGCWETGGEYGDYQDAAVIDAVHRALDLGVTLFDTARGYGFGRSEELLAKALGPRRNDVIVVSKVGIYKQADGRYGRDSSRAALLRGLEESLQSLHTDFVDLLLVHWPDRTRPLAEAMETLDEIQRSGKARQVGVSNFHAGDLREAAPHARLVTNQVGYNLFDRRWEREMFPTAEALGLGIMAYGPLAHGLLTGHFSPAERFVAGDWRAQGRLFGQPLLAPENLAANTAVVENLEGLARELGMTVAQLAISWVLQNPLVGVALTGCRTTAEIEENAAAAGRTLDAPTLRAIDECMAGARGQVAELPD